MRRRDPSPGSIGPRSLNAGPLLLGLIGLCVAAACGTETQIHRSTLPALDELIALPTQGRHLIVVLSDTHRLDHVSGFSQDERRLTPNLARLMHDGVTFTNANTPVPISAPAYASLMTGLKPTEHGLLNNEQPLATGLPLLQERLQRGAYQTAAVVGNPFCASGYGFGRGFDFFWDEIRGRGKEGEVITTEAIRWLDSADTDRPFFLFLAYMDAHTPYISDENPPSLRIDLNRGRTLDLVAENAHIEHRIPLDLEPGRNTVTLSFLDDGDPAETVDGPSPLHVKDLGLASGRTIHRTTGVEQVPASGFERLDNRAVLTIDNPDSTPVDDELVFRCYRKYRTRKIPAFYEAGVRSFDRSFGRLLDHLQARGLYRDSTVVFVSDHGEMLGEHGVWGHVPHLYQETLNIPLIIKAPGLTGGRRDSTPLDLRDLHDLLAGMTVGFDTDLRQALDGRRRDPFVAATYPPEASRLQAAAISGRFKVIADVDGEERVFDLDADPGETTDIIDHLGEEPVVRALLTAAHGELAVASETETLDMDALSPEERDRLRALGYLDAHP